MVYIYRNRPEQRAIILAANNFRPERQQLRLSTTTLIPCDYPMRQTLVRMCSRMNPIVLFVGAGRTGVKFLVRKDNVWQVAQLIKLLRSFEPNIFLVIGKVMTPYLLVRLGIENNFENASGASIPDIELFDHLNADLGRISLQTLFHILHHRRNRCSLMRDPTMPHFDSTGFLIPFYGAIHKDSVQI